VLERAGEPMRAQEIHAGAEQLSGNPLLWTSVKVGLAAGASGERPRFRRVRRGVYQSTKVTSRGGDADWLPRARLDPQQLSASLHVRWDRDQRT
jgi:hypothetical protein